MIYSKVMFNNSLTARRRLNVVFMHEFRLIRVPIMQFGELWLAAVFGLLV